MISDVGVRLAPLEQGLFVQRSAETADTPVDAQGGIYWGARPEIIGIIRLVAHAVLRTP